MSTSITNINLAISSGTSIYTTSAANAGSWDVTAGGVNTNAEYWYGNGTFTAQSGYGPATLYAAISPVAGGTNVSSAGTVTLNSSGLSFATNAVPLPPALWLLGSGLLGLAGISRRKPVAA